jgi:hypothetical protein
MQKTHSKLLKVSDLFFSTVIQSKCKIHNNNIVFHNRTYSYFTWMSFLNYELKPSIKLLPTAFLLLPPISHKVP